MSNKKVLRQALAVIPMCLIEFSLGLGYGWVAPILSQLRNSDSEYSLTAEQCSWIASLHYLTRAAGPLIVAATIDRVGRNRVIVAITLLCFLMWIIILSSRAVVVLYVSRVICGWAMGMFETTVSIYIGETCSPEIRGRVTGLATACFYAGELAVFIMTAYLSYNHVTIVHASVTFTTIISTILLKEPVHFLIMKGNMERAERNFNWLQNAKDGNAKVRFEEIAHNVLEEQSKTSFAQIFNAPVARKSLRIVVLILFLTMCTGFSAVNSFITMAFFESKYLTPNEFTALYGLLQLITSSIASFVMDKFNRRTLMLNACAVITVTQVATAALYFVHRLQAILYFDWLLFVTLTVYSCTFGMLLFPLCSAIRGELLPQSVKGVGCCLSVMASSLSAFGAARIFLPIAETYGVETNFIVFSFASLVLFMYVYFDLPETRGKSLVEIQKDLKEMRKSGASD